MNTQNLKKLFLKYRDAGYRPFPVICYEYLKTDENGVETVRREKTPQVKWQDYQNRLPTNNEIDKWCAHPMAGYYGIGMATEGLVLVDFDVANGSPDLDQFADEMPLGSTMWSATPSGGIHLYFLNDTGENIRNATNIFHKDKANGDTLVDIRANGGYVVMGETELWSHNPNKAQGGAIFPEPPTVKKAYKTDNFLPFNELPGVPACVRAVLLTSQGAPRKEAKCRSLKLDEQVKEGNRNDTAASLAYKLLSVVNNIREFEIQERTYWEVIKEKWENWKEGEQEYQTAWNSAILKIRQQRGINWPDQSNVLISQKKQEVKEDIQYHSDINEWGLKIEQVIRIGEIFKFKLEDGESFELEASDFLSQTKFRTAYTYGTNKMLKKIKEKSFEKFLLNLKPVDLVDSGTSLKDMILEILNVTIERISPSVDEEEAKEVVSTGSWAVFKNKIYFNPQSLMQTHGYLSKRATVSKVVSTLSDMGAKQDSFGKIKFWSYEI